MVAFERQDIVGFLVDDVGRDFFLASHGVDGDGAVGDFQHAQEFGNRGNLVGLVVDFDLSAAMAAGGVAVGGFSGIVLLLSRAVAGYINIDLIYDMEQSRWKYRGRKHGTPGAEALEKAIEGYQSFIKLAEGYADEVIRVTRLEQEAKKRAGKPRS